VGLFADRFPALVDVSIDERISADTGAAAGAVPRSRRPVSTLDLIAGATPCRASVRVSLEFLLLAVIYQIKHAKELYFGKKIAVKFLGFWF
jgi:hypothetical protein